MARGARILDLPARGETGMSCAVLLPLALAIATFVHFGKKLRLQVAPGIEREHGHNEFSVRAGLAYQFRLKRVSVSPAFNVDFVDGEEITVYGISVGWGF